MEKCFLEKKLLPITVHPIQRFLLSSFARHEHNIFGAPYFSDGYISASV